MKKLIAGLLCLLLLCPLLAGCGQKPLLGQGLPDSVPGSGAAASESVPEPPRAESTHPPASEPDTSRQEAEIFDSSASPIAIYDTKTETWFELGDARAHFDEVLGFGMDLPDYVEEYFPDGDAPENYTYRQYLLGALTVEFVDEKATGMTVYNIGNGLARFTYRGAAMGRVPVSFLEILYWDAWEDEYGGADCYDYFHQDTDTFGYVEFQSYVYLYDGALESFGVMVYDLDALLYGESGFSAGAKPL